MSAWNCLNLLQSAPHTCSIHITFPLHHVNNAIPPIPTRLDIGVPDDNGRLEILRIHTKNMKLAPNPVPAFPNVFRYSSLGTGRISNGVG